MFDVLRRRISLPQSCERSLTSLCGRLSESAEVFRDGGIVCPCSSFVMQRQDVYCSLLFLWAHLVAPSVKGHGTTTECCSLPRGTMGTSTGHWAELVINACGCLHWLSIDVQRNQKTCHDMTHDSQEALDHLSISIVVSCRFLQSVVWQGAEQAWLANLLGSMEAG